MAKQRHLVLPIKDEVMLRQVEGSLYHDFRMGRRNYTIFKVGMTTLLRVSDVLRLRYGDVFYEDGTVKKDTYIKDKKTSKGNIIILKYVAEDLERYRDWLFAYLKRHRYYDQWKTSGRWLFISSRNATNHFGERPFYFVMQKVGRNLGINYLGTHTMRKTGAYLVFKQTNRINLVMKLLNHSSEETTLRYLGIDREEIEQSLDQVFGNSHIHF